MHSLSRNPTVKDGNVWMQLHWPLYSFNNKEYFKLAIGNNSTVGFGPRTNQCAFWKDYLPKLVKDVSK